jgi:hypothetical protein
MRAGDQILAPPDVIVEIDGPDALRQATAIAVALGHESELPIEVAVPTRRTRTAVTITVPAVVANLLDRAANNGFLQRILSIAPRARVTADGAPPPATSGLAPPPAPPVEWDWFLAHSGGEKNYARSLFAALAPHGRPFLDSSSLQPGDRWDEALPGALRVSAVIAVVVSATVGWYLADEVQAGIRYVRRWGASRRVVPVFLGGQPDDPLATPYGLGTVVGVDARLGLEAVTDALRSARRRIAA